MLASAADFKAQLLTLKPTIIPIVGITAFVGVLADFMNQVQGGPTGAPGIFIFNNAVMIPLMLVMPPVPDKSWIPVFVLAWQTAVMASVIVPGTILNPVWLGSGGLDAATLPIGAATIPTIAAAAAILTSGLNAIDTADDKTLQFATAIRDATLAFIFTAIGLGPLSVQIPIPIPAE